MTWLGFERRRLDRLCAAALPGHDASEEFWREFFEIASPTLRSGLRAAVWVFTLTPLSLDRALNSRSYAVRQLGSTLRLVACMAHFSA